MNLRRPTIALLATMPFIICQLTAQPPHFEVASVKRHVDGAQSVDLGDGRLGFGFGPKGLSISGSRVNVTAESVNWLVAYAFDLRADEVLGGPDWASGTAGSDLFDIVAKVDDATTPSKEQLRLMLQTLLTDRFRLTFHPQDKEVPVYNLVVGEKGLKIQESAPNAKTGVHDVFLSNSHILRTAYSRISMDQLCTSLTNSRVITDRPLINKTGLTGYYDFSLDLPAEMAPDERASATFSAIQELGLRVQAAKESRRMLVVDHIERPSPN